jgi:ABC-type sulfate/molybdate transport systems ATPase subunit
VTTCQYRSGWPRRCPAILELRDLVVAVPGGGRAAISLPYREVDLTVVTAGPGAATATARTVAGLAPPISGQVLIGNRDVTTLPPGRRQIGYVPRGGALLPHLTVQENIKYLIQQQESVRGLVNKWTIHLIYQLELGPVLDQRPHEITAQQRMRAAVARAVISLPEVLVLERPELSVCGPLDELLARIASPESGAPATVVFGDVPAPAGAAHAEVADS